MADKILDFLEGVAKSVESKELLVGFVDGATYTDGTSVADVAYQNEFGNPANNQPARPFFRNAIEGNEEAWKDSMLEGLRAGHSVTDVFEIIGAVAAADVRQSIIDLYSPELSPATIEMRSNAKFRESVGKPVNYSTKPLEDTKTMLNDVNYEVRDIES